VIKILENGVLLKNVIVEAHLH